MFSFSNLFDHSLFNLTNYKCKDYLNDLNDTLQNNK